MALTVGEQVRWWSLALIGLVLVLWLLLDAVLPFIIGAVIAYFADPLADRLERMGLSRILSTCIIIVGSTGILVVLLVLVIPTIIDQVVALIRQAPEFLRQVQTIVETRLPDLSADSKFLAGAIEEMDVKVKKLSAEVVTGVVSGTFSLLNLLIVLVVAPVVAFYMLYDWDNIIAEVDDWLPRQHRPVIHRLASEVDDVLAGFIRGQVTVCLILGMFYAVALSALGLNFGFLIGAFAGLISFIPFVGSIFGGLLSIGVALAQFWAEPGMVIAVAVVFLSGQAVEGNYLTPKLVGGHVKLHPVWLMFALSAFGGLFGFVGMLVAVPAAAAIGVLGRFMMSQYKEGRLYRGAEIASGTRPPGDRLLEDPERSAREPDDRA
ncbi:MAG: AI-2E family transporter [Pseudomonadota bacterium]